MKILDALNSAADRQMLVDLYASGLLAGLAVVIMCGVLSVLVVVKRLGFVGQGVSHSAFGGIGVAALLAALGFMPDSGVPQLAVVIAFCMLAAIGMAAVGDKKGVPIDTAIGLFLVGSMAVGAILVQVARAIKPGASQSWEAILFGSILTTVGSDVVVACVAALLVIAATWWFRRPLLFWALDEDAARAFGVPTSRMKLLLMVLLCICVVVAMRLAGVVLATALLVLPGATALRLSDRLAPVLTLSITSGIVSLLAGLMLSYELDWQAGPTVVVVMLGLFVCALALGKLRSRAATPTPLGV